MKNTFLCVLIVLLGYSQVSAQSLISRYQFASSSGTYTAITGGTVWQSGATLATNAVTNVTLPFTFNFNGTNYTTINISNNGFITFGATAPAASDYAALSTSTSYSGAIVGYGLNLVNSPVGGATPEIRYEQVGSEFIIQFQDLGRTGISGDRMNFQIRLTQTTNTIKIVYGTWAATTTTTAAPNMGQVGLRGASNTDYSGRNVNATSPYNTWASSGGSTATLNTNTGTMRYNSTVLPASGLTYTWTVNSTYSALPYTQNFEATPWGNRNSLQDAASNTSMSTFPQLGNPAWKRQDATTANSLWGSTFGALAALTGAQGTGVARFHSYNASTGAKGYMDFYLDFSTSGTKQLTFDYQNTSGTDNLQVALSTDGGLTFSNIGSAYGVAASWTAQTVSSLSSSTSSTVVLRFIATSDFGNDDIGVDNVNVFVPVTPTISGFIPTPNLCLNGGQTVTLTGTNFTGTTAVTFNGVNASSFSVVNSTTITAVTPSSLTAGVITVTTAGGSASSGLYTVVTNPTVAVSPTSNSLCVPGASAIALTASGASTYTWGPASGLSATTGTSVNALPTSSTTYTVIGTDANGCTATSTSVFTVTAGVLATASASPLNVCNGANSQLDVEAVQGGGLSVIGAGASNSSSTAASFFPGFWGGAKTQYIVLGSELIAQGLKAGNITALAYEPTTAGQTYQGFFISLGTTAQSSMTTSFITTGLTEVYAGTLANNGILPVANTVNTLTFGTGGTASSFYWDGSSNIVVSISWSSVPNASTATSSTMKVDAPGFTCSAYDQQDNVSPATMKASTAADGTGTNRPRFTFTGNKLVVSPTYAWTESPATTLSSTSIANPMSNGITATNNYTVTVTGAGGCTATSTLTVNVAGSVVCSAITSSNGATLCAGQNTTLTASATIGGTPYTYDWTADPTLSATNIANPIATPTATTTYTCTVTDACGTTCSTTITINVNALPTVVVSPTSGTICNPGGTSVSLTASGTATGYTWLPATGLSATSGASVNALPSSSTTYTVTGTDANGCTGTSSAVISVNLIPVLTSVTATPATICSGDNSNLSAVHQTVTTAAGMIYSASTGASFETITSPTVVTSATGGADDGYMTVTPAGFTFPFLNTSNTSFGVGTNGYIVLGSNSSSIPSSITSITSLNLIYAFGRDGNLNVSNGGSLTHGFDATNTKYIFEMVKYSGGGSGAESSTIYASYQIVLWGSTSTEPGKIEVIYGTNLGTPASSGTIGIRDVAGTYINGINGLTNSTATQSTWPVSGQKYSYSLPGSPTFSWSPATFLSSTTVSNPTATAVTSTTPYTVTATANGCSTTGTVTVTVSTGASITTDPANTSACTNSNASFTVAATGPGLTYQWFVDDGTGFVAITPGAPYSGETSATLTISNPSASLNNYQYQVEVSSTCGSGVTSQPATLTVNTPASVTTNPTSGLICNPGGTAVSVTASGANTYTWAPTSGLTPSTGATVSANPSSTTTYTVTGTDGNGCTATSTVAITTAQAITSLNTTGSSTSVCEGAPITLASAGVLAGYQMNVAGTEVFYDINTTGTTVGTQGDDSEHNISMPSFVFNGVAYTTARVGNNGAIALGSTTGSIEWGNVALPSTANGAGNVLLLPFWDDLDVTLVDDIQTEIVGSKFIIQYTNKDHNSFNTGGITFQVQLDNATGEIHFIYDDVTFGDVAYDAGASATIGIQYSSTSALQYSFNTASLTTGQCITFTPNTLAYNWTGPNSYSAATQNASVNPSVSASAGTYTVTATSGAGCTLTSTATIAVNPTSVPTSVNTYSQTFAHTDGLSNLYVDPTCNIIATISDASGGNALGSTTVQVDVLSTLPQNTNNNRYFLPRYYTITPTSNGISTVSFYLTQADLDLYNASNGTQADLPANSTDLTKTVHMRVMQVTGNGDLTTGTLVPDYATMTWDGTNNRWEVIAPATITNSTTFNTSGKYYFFTNESCSGINITGLTATPSTTSVALSWDPAVTLQGWYAIRHKVSGSSTWDYSTSSVPSKTLTGLTPGATYEVEVYRKCSAVDSGAIASTTFSTPSCASGAPVIVTPITTTTATTATFSWNAVLIGGGWHDIQYRVAGATTWIAGSSGSSNSTMLANLASGTTYEVQVRANCSGGTPSGWSIIAQFTTASGGCATGTPIIVTPITTTSTTASISWNAVLAGGGWHDIQYRIVGSPTWINGSSGSGNSTTLGGLTSGATYEVQVRANCSAGAPSAWSTAAQFTTVGCATGTPAINTPITATSTTVAISWNAVLVGGGWHDIQYRIVGSPTWINGSSGSGSSTTIAGLTSGTTYEIRVRAACSAGAPSAWSNAAQFTTLGCVSGNITLNPATTTPTTASLSWNSVLLSGGWHDIRYRPVGSPTWLLSSCGTSSAATLAGLTTGVQYEAEVRAGCSLGNGNWSNTIQFTPSQPSCVTGTITLNTPSTTATTVSLSWNAVLVAGGWHDIQYRVFGAPSWTAGSSGSGNTTVIANLQSATTYELRLRAACTGATAGNWSDIITFTTGAPMMPILFEEETAKAGFVVYPNPTRDQITIEFSTETLQATKVKVLDMTGRVVKTVEAVPQAGEHQYTLSLSELSAGMYTVQVYTDDKLSYVTKVQKQD